MIEYLKQSTFQNCTCFSFLILGFPAWVVIYGPVFSFFTRFCLLVHGVSKIFQRKVERKKKKKKTLIFYLLTFSTIKTVLCFCCELWMYRPIRLHILIYMCSSSNLQTSCWSDMIKTSVVFFCSQNMSEAVEVESSKE